MVDFPPSNIKQVTLMVAGPRDFPQTTRPSLRSLNHLFSGYRTSPLRVKQPERESPSTSEIRMNGANHVRH
jgi:hypothetical protein